MPRTLTLTLADDHELLLQAMEAFQQSDIFEDEGGNAIKLSVEDIALNMLVDGCLEWITEFGGVVPEELELKIAEAFDPGDGHDCDDEDCDEDHDHSASNN